jgi:acyl-CoA synthetase (AMP-forming)/AMP-acid ligase II
VALFFLVFCFFSHSGRSYIVMPLFHVHGLMSALFAALYAGGSVVLPSRGRGFQAEPFWRDIAQ